MAKKQHAEKTNALRSLDSAGIHYETYAYDTADGKLDGVSVAAKTGFPVEMMFKTLVTQGASGGLYVFVVPVAEELDLKKAAKAAKEKNIVMLPQKELLKHTGYIHGGCSPVGMKRQYPTFIDESVILLTTMCCSAGKVGLQMEVAPDELCRITGAVYADICKQEG